jgi:hypothetical protein
MSLFPDREEAWERGARLIDSVKRGGTEKMIGWEVVLEGRAVVEAAFYGIGHDFVCDETYVRVHSPLLERITVPSPCASCCVCVFGRVLNIYAPMRVVVVSVKLEDYIVTGTT